MNNALRVTIWNEGVHEKTSAKVRAVYPIGIGRQIAQYLERQPGIAAARVSGLDQPEQGLGQPLLNETDVLVWWGHKAHGQVEDAHVERVWQRVVSGGMGIVVLHSGHFSKIFKRLMGTGCDLKWREADERERIWVVNPGHPIAQDIPEHFEIEKEEMYGEHFDIPPPDELVFISWFQGGEVFRSGCCWHRGRGKVFYFRPGHETYPTYHHELVLKVIANGIRWAAPSGVPSITRGNAKPLERL